MITSDDLDLISPAWVKALGNLGSIPKNRTARIPRKSGQTTVYDYADLASIIDTAKPVLLAEGLTVTQSSIPAPPGQVGFVTRVTHTSGQWMQDEGLFMPAPSDPKAVGASITYLRRYSMVAFLGLATEDDDDATRAGDSIREDEEEHRARAALEQRVLSCWTQMVKLDEDGRAALKSAVYDEFQIADLGKPALFENDELLGYVENKAKELGQ